MPVVLILSAPRARYLLDIVSMWAEGHADAMEETINAPSEIYEDIETFAWCVENMRQQWEDALELRQQIEHSLGLSHSS